MAKIKFVRGDERRFLTIEELAETDSTIRELMKHWAPSELVGTLCFHHEGSDEEPQLFEVELPPNHEVAAHAHTADEIIVVVEGEIHFGKQVYGVGSSVYIPKMTLYAFKTGPDGVLFLNFRPTSAAGTGGISKDEFMAMRAAR